MGKNGTTPGQDNTLWSTRCHCYNKDQKDCEFNEFNEAGLNTVTEQETRTEAEVGKEYDPRLT